MSVRPNRRPPAARLLLIPLSLLAALLVAVHLVDAAAPHEGARPAAAVQGLAPPATPGDPTCTRAGHDRDDEVPDRIRGDVGPDQRVTSATVLGCPVAFDGVQVRYAGEVIGDILRRDGGAWLQVNDDAYALEVGPLGTHRERRGSNTGLAVWVTDEQLAELGGAGRPGQRGDVIQLLGTVVRADATDGGGLTLHAQELEVLARAERFDEPLHVAQLAFALTMGVVALGMTLLHRRAARGPAPHHRGGPRR